jgi:hypothetical protein
MDIRRKKAIYCRVALADEGRIAAQEALLRAYAEEHGYGHTICYRDNGAAGNTLNRPAMAALTADIRAGKIGAVLAVNTSRIARTLPLMSEWRELLDRHGAIFVAPEDGGRGATATELEYQLVGDYLLPAIQLREVPAERKERPLGRYARQYSEYLRTWRPILYSKLALTEELFPTLWAIDDAAQTRFDSIADRDIAHEIIISELFSE